MDENTIIQEGTNTPCFMLNITRVMYQSISVALSFLKIMTFDDVFTYRNLFASYKKCLKGVRWKGKVQYYQHHALTNLYTTYKEIYNETFKTGKFYEFNLMERGKLRKIKSVSFKERVVQRCFCDYCLVPLLSKYFIYDNYACIKEKGMHFALKRMKYILQKGYRKYKTNNFYILQYDFKSFFDTIPHKELVNSVCAIVKDEKLCNLYRKLVNDFGGDVGLGLGSQISQISALFYPKDLDHYFKKKNLLAYGRYMDDGFLISKEINNLKSYRTTLIKKMDQLKLKPNYKKIHIKRISHGFVYLKARYFLTNSGKVIIKPNRKNITRNRKKLLKLVNKNKTFNCIDSFAKIVIGNLKCFNAYNTIKNFKDLYYSIKEKNNGIYCLHK